jgi:ribosome maturation factor RimP
MNQSTLRKLIREEIAKATNENVDTMTMKRGIKNVINDILSSLDSLDIDALQNLSSSINRAADMVKSTSLSKSSFQGDPCDMETPSKGDWRGKTSPSA